MDYDFRVARAAEDRFKEHALTVDADHVYAMRPVLAFGVQLRLAEGIDAMEQGRILDGARLVREAVSRMLVDPDQVEDLLDRVDAAELMTALVILFPQTLGASRPPSPNDGNGSKPTAPGGTDSISPPLASVPTQST